MQAMLTTRMFIGRFLKGSLCNQGASCELITVASRHAHSVSPLLSYLFRSLKNTVRTAWSVAAETTVVQGFDGLGSPMRKSALAPRSHRMHSRREDLMHTKEVGG